MQNYYNLAHRADDEFISNLALEDIVNVLFFVATLQIPAEAIADLNAISTEAAVATDVRHCRYYKA